MSRDARAGLVGAVFGLVFVLVNAGDLPSPWSLVVRVLGVLAFVAVVVVLRRGGAEPLPSAGRRALRLYGVAVVVEVLALFGGTSLLNQTGHEELGLPWVVIVVGLHFVPIGFIFRAKFFYALAGILVALGVLGSALALAGTDRWVVSLVTGVGAGATLLTFATRPSLERARPSGG
ncbi:MAG: hypothetical protein JWR85_2341 [Marmoricola sp.]|nr:hypothetical protein [Marmoricola sp.]